MNAENVFKSWVTTILGCVIMCAAAYGWWVDHLSDLQGGTFGSIGFALLFMRDQIPNFLIKLFNKKVDGDSNKKE